MAQLLPKADIKFGRDLVARWRILAERRLEHLTELYQSGRWKLYHTESNFLAMIQEARANLKVWEQLAPADVVLDKNIEVAIAQEELKEGATSSALPKPGLLDGIRPHYDLRKL